MEAGKIGPFPTPGRERERVRVRVRVSVFDVVLGLWRLSVYLSISQPVYLLQTL